MVHLNLEKLHVTFADETHIFPRRYTQTHSDASGDLYFTIGPNYNMKQISGLYTRFMRDEVLAEWPISDEGPILHVYCHVGGGLLFGSMNMRERIFRREMPLVIEVICKGDTDFFDGNPNIKKTPIEVHYQKSGKDYKIEMFWFNL